MKFPQAILDSLSVFSSPQSNSIIDAKNSIVLSSDFAASIPKDCKELTSDLSNEELEAALYRNTHRHGFILNSQELASVLHFPSKPLQHPKLLRQRTGRRDIPDEFTI